MKIETTINSNGSKWYGEEPDNIEKLMEVLKEEPLDRRFEAFGDFCYPSEGLPGNIRFMGNFFRLSHVFNIDTNDIGLIKKLARAIDLNKQRPDYKSQPKPKRPLPFCVDAKSA